MERFRNQETKYIVVLSVLLASVRDLKPVFLKSRQTINMGSSNSTLSFEPILTKVVSGDFSKSHYEGQKGEYFCSNSKNGCEEEEPMINPLQSWSRSF